MSPPLLPLYIEIHAAYVAFSVAESDWSAANLKTHEVRTLSPCQSAVLLWREPQEHPAYASLSRMIEHLQADSLKRPGLASLGQHTDLVQVCERQRPGQGILKSASKN